MSAAPSAESQAEQGPTLHDLIRQGKSFSGRERHCCFLNLRDGTFANVSSVSGLGLPDDGRAIGLTDWDADGDLDLWIANRSGPQLRFFRNHSAEGNQYLQLELVGTTGNRDAIGARVELYESDASAPQLRTLSAGDGFLSQSSKLIHFGLVSEASLDKLLVRWPGGAVETFEQLEPNQRYRLVEGRGAPEVVAGRPPLSLDEAARLAPAASSESAHVVSMAALPLPDLDYVSFDGKSHRVPLGSGQPVLVNLWASWCQPCLAELQEWTSQASAFREAGLEIVALSVDGLDQPTRDESRQLAQRTVERLAPPFTCGLATRETVATLQLVQNGLLDAHRDLLIPTSLLVDGEGRLLALYKGSAGWESVLADLAAGSSQSENHGLPFAGKWFARRQRSSPFELVRSLIGHDLTDVAAAYLDKHGARLQSDPEFPKLLSHLGAKLLAEGKAGAAEKYREALTRAPPDADHHYNLGLALQSQGKLSAAMEEYRQALSLDDQHARAHNNLAAAYASQGQLDQAVHHFRRVVQLDPDYAEGHFNLGNTLIGLGRLPQAIAQFQQAIELEPTYAKAHNNLAVALHRVGRTDEARQHLMEAKRLKSQQQKPGGP